MCELGRGDFERRADVVEEFGWDKCGGGDVAWSFVFGMCFIWIGVDVYVVFGEFWVQNVVVCCVAEGVEGLVRVFDGQFDDGWVVEASSVDCCIEMHAVA